MFLCIDTATVEAGVALVKDDSVTYLPLDVKNASETLISVIDQLLKNSEAELSDLKGVMVIKGPGSFTGLRVGIAVANQFAHQLSMPIIGLRTDEWFSYRTDETDYLYLQTMNRDQAYAIGFGSLKNWSESEIVSIQDLQELSGKKWIGQLSDDHRSTLSLEPIAEVSLPEKAWQLASVLFREVQDQQKYNLVEPFYGKEPNITITKRKLSI